MSEYTSPVPNPGEPAPEPYREIYPMPAFAIAPTADLAASLDFWTRGLGFIELFSVPGQVIHLRRWAFQDVLLIPGEPAAAPSAVALSFSCVLEQVDAIARRCEELAPGCVSGPRDTLWRSVEVEVVTPEKTRVIMTGAKPVMPGSVEEQQLRDLGIDVP